MATFQRKTLRNFTPLAREIAESINECDAVKRRLVRLLGYITECELDAAAFRRRFPGESRLANLPKDKRGRPNYNKGRQTLADLNEYFHDPAPLERRVLGE